MPTAGKLLTMCALAVTSALAARQQAAAPAPPPIEVAFDRVTPEAALNAGAVTTIGSTSDAVWLLGDEPAALVRVNAKTNRADAPIQLDASPCEAVATAGATVWVPICGARSLARIDATSGALARLAMPDLAASGGGAATGVGSLWLLADGRGTLLRIDPDSGLPVADVYLPEGTSALAFGLDALWAAATETNEVVRINPHTNVIDERISAGKAPRSLAIGDGAVWVLNAGDGTLSRIDPGSNRVVATVEVGAASAKGAMAVGAGAVWVSAPGAPLLRVDTRTHHVTHRLSGPGGGPIAFAHRSLWIRASESAVWRVDPRLVAALR